MSGMVQTVGQVSALIAEITHASDEQSLGISQINQAVNHMDSVTQQNSAMVEQLAAAASSLQEQAKTMEDAVGIFRLEGKRQSRT
jgi:aerotaxis receptor